MARQKEPELSEAAKQHRFEQLIHAALKTPPTPIKRSASKAAKRRKSARGYLRGFQCCLTICDRVLASSVVKLRYPAQSTQAYSAMSTSGNFSAHSACCFETIRMYTVRKYFIFPSISTESRLCAILFRSSLIVQNNGQMSSFSAPSANDSARYPFVRNGRFSWSS